MEQNTNQENQKPTDEKNGLISTAKIVLYIQLLLLALIALLFVILKLVTRVDPEQGFMFVLLAGFLGIGIYYLLLISSITGLVISIIVFVKKRKGLLSTSLLIISILILTGISTFIIKNQIEIKERRKVEEQQRIAQQNFAIERYETLSKELEIPQKVLSIYVNGNLILGSNKIVVLRTSYGSITEGLRTLKEFVDTNVVGKEVIVILPEKEVFLKDYSYLNGNDYFKAKVYFEGELLKE